MPEPYLAHPKTKARRAQAPVSKSVKTRYKLFDAPVFPDPKRVCALFSKIYS